MRKCLRLCLALLLFASCKKKEETTASATPLSGTWTNSAWGGTANNTIKFSMSSDGKTGTVTQLGSTPYGFVVGDALYSSLTTSSNGTYTGNGKYTYGNNNSSSGQAAVTLTLQNNGATLYAHYSRDAATGITPPDYYYQKQ